MRNTGKNMELEFVTAIDNHKYCELNENLKNFVSFIFDNITNDDIIHCQNLANNEKADISITYKNEIKMISLKTGSENSVHVEKLDDFIIFLDKLNFDTETINNIKLYHFGDNTLTGDGIIRYSAEEAKLKYQEEITQINKKINFSNKPEKFIERFLLKGKNEHNKCVDIIYYGNINHGVWCNKEEIIEYAKSNKCMHMRTPHFYFLTYQNWCRNIKKNKKSESHRYYIQIKWFSILSDISKIRNINNSKYFANDKPHITKKNT